MDLFENVRRSDENSSAETEMKEVFLGILLLTAASDGHVANEEADAIMVASHRMKLFRDLSEAQFDSMLDRIQGQLKRDPKAIIAKAKTALPKELQEAAFAMAADLTFADGRLREREKELLLSLQAALGIPDDLAARIVEVMSIKNYG